jgi:hypothetical protein
MEKWLISESFKFDQDESDIDFKITIAEHEILMECLDHCLGAIQFSIPLAYAEGYLNENTLSYTKAECIENLRARLGCLHEMRVSEKPHEKIEEYMDKDGHKSYVTIQLDDN